MTKEIFNEMDVQCKMEQVRDLLEDTQKIILHDIRPPNARLFYALCAAKQAVSNMLHELERKAE